MGLPVGGPLPVAGMPEGGADPGFETGECADVRPGFAVDDAGDGGVGDPALAGDDTSAVAGRELSEPDGELAGGFGSGIDTLLIRPGIGERPGRWAWSAGHERSVGAHTEPLVHSSTKNVTPDWKVGAWKHRYSSEVRTVEERIDNYQPRMDPDHWAEIAYFTKATVRDSQPDTTYKAGTLLSIVSAYVHWAWQQGLPLERTTAFDRWNIERFIATGCPGTWSPATRGNCRSMLFRVAESLLGHAASTLRLNPIKGSQPLTPYTDNEITQFRGWAESQLGTEWRRRPTALLALGLGAGLTTINLGLLRRRHVTATENGIIIEVPGPKARTTAVLAGGEDDLKRAINDLDPDEYVVRRYRTRPSKNLITGLVAETSGLHKPEGQRLRVTWMVHHLTVGTPIPVLVTATRLKSLGPITRYLKFVELPAADVALAHLRRRGQR